MAEKNPGRKSFFRRIKGFFSGLFGSERTLVGKSSHFDYILRGRVAKGSDEGKNAALAVSLCDEALDIVRKRVRLIERLMIVNETIENLECYAALSDEELSRLRNLMERLGSLRRDRNVLKNQLLGFEKSLSYMRELEDDAIAAIPEILEAEEKQRDYRTDLGYIEGERAELEHENGILGAGLVFIDRLTVVMLALLGAAAMFLAYRFAFQNDDVLVSMIIIGAVALVMFSALYIAKRRMRFELKQNLYKQKRAVELLNKKTAVFAHYTNFLNYEYRKYRVKNSKMLEENLKEYGLYRYLTRRSDSVRNISYQTERELEEFLRARNIQVSPEIFDRFEAVFDVDNKLAYYNEMKAEKNATQINLEELDKRHEEIWDSLTALSEGDSFEDGLVNTVIKAYLEAAGLAIGK